MHKKIMKRKHKQNFIYAHPGMVLVQSPILCAGMGWPNAKPVQPKTSTKT